MSTDFRVSETGVRYGRYVLREADPESFRVLTPFNDGYGQWARDAKTVWWCESVLVKPRVLHDVEVRTFEPLSERLARDAKRIFNAGRPIVDADVESFRRVPSGLFFRDDARVYYGPFDARAFSADAATFEPMWSRWGRDKNGFTYERRRIGVRALRNQLGEKLFAFEGALIEAVRHEAAGPFTFTFRRDAWLRNPGLAEQRTYSESIGVRASFDPTPFMNVSRIWFVSRHVSDGTAHFRVVDPNNGSWELGDASRTALIREFLAALG